MKKRSPKRGSGAVVAAPAKAAKSPSRETSAPAGPVPWRFVLGAVFLLVAAGASLLLGLEHVTGLALPGCGPGSACAELSRSAWGKVPIVNWPVSFLGLAYFLGALLAWLASRGRVATGFRCLVRLGVLASIGFTVIMIVQRHLCDYCLAVHIANIAFWILLELAPHRAARWVAGLGSLGGAFVLATAILAVVEWRVRAAVAARAEADLAQSTSAIIAKTEETRHTTGPAATDSSAAMPATVASGPTPPTSVPATTQPRPWLDDNERYPDGFRGRYLYGPEKAAVRLVIITDYQCPDCKAKEAEVRTLLQKYNNISLSIKHYPFSTFCNPRVPRDKHPNACWAARAAEAAGMLWGDAGFFAMHHWLFDHDGLFLTTKELEDGVRGLGYDPAGFVQVLQSEETSRRVRLDLEEAEALGLFQTPMIFINGVELRGWNAPNAVIRAVEAVLARNPEPQTHAGDRPPLAIGKCIGDWQEQFVIPPMPDTVRWPLGPDQAKVRIVVHGDFQEPVTAEADATMREWVAGRSDSQYVFRPYPFNQECNPHVQSTKFEQGCWAARVATAAGQVGGGEAYWRLHQWLFKNQSSFNDDALRAAAGELGVDVSAVLAAAQQPDVAAAIREDVDVGKRLGINSIPTILINGKRVMLWRYMGAEKGKEVLTAILNEAAK